MPKWNVHVEWAERFLEWGDLRPAGGDIGLADFPKRKEFIHPDHDFNRRVWRSEENRSIIYYAFEERGLMIMDLHYCLDFLKEETSLEILEQRAEMVESLYPGFKEKDLVEVYPTVKELAKYLAMKVKTLSINKTVFNFVLVNLREILRDIISESGYDPESLEDWNSSVFNQILDEVELIGN